MRRKIVFGFVLGLTLSGMTGAQAATALTAPLTAPDSVAQIAGGCGPYAHRGYNGVCRPNRPPPPVYRRACPYGYHPTPYGCRRNY